MQSSSRESSLWRSLAVAFGDGLAFGVGMKLTQAAGRQFIQQAPAAPRQDAGQLTDRVVERAPVAASSTADQKVLETIINALEARLAEHSGQVERRLADLDARLAIELRALDQQDAGLTQRITGEIQTLQQQVVALNRQFSEAVARIVAEQVGSQVEARTAALEQTMSRRIAIAAEAAVAPYLANLRREMQESITASIAGRVAQQVEERAVAIEQQLRAELAHRDAEIAELRKRVTEADQNVLEVILSIGEVCRNAANRLGAPGPAPEGGEPPPPAAPEEPRAGPPAGSGPILSPEAPIRPMVSQPPARMEPGNEPPAPGLAQGERGSRLWRVPLVG